MVRKLCCFDSVSMAVNEVVDVAEKLVCTLHSVVVLVIKVACLDSFERCCSNACLGCVILPFIKCRSS